MATNKDGCYLGFDFGMKKIGIAVGQLVTSTAKPLIIISAKDGIPVWVEIDKIINDWQPNALIVGDPLNMDGTTQQVTFCARKFANKLRARYKVVVEMFDERLTTRAASSFLAETKGLNKLKKTKVDAIAAAIILEAWLEMENSKNDVSN